MAAFAYRGFTASTGKALAQRVYMRCKHNVAEFEKRAGINVKINQPIALSNRDEESKRLEFGIWHDARVFGGQKWSPWSADVEIVYWLHGAPAFEVLVQTQGSPPKEILRCLESTYNEIKEGFGR